MATVSALYDRASDAQNAVRELVNNGFSRDNISVIASDAAGEFSRFHGKRIPSDTMPDETMEGVGAGALVGGLGGLAIGLAALAIPGVGPVIAAGPLATALVGAGVGAVTGGIIGGLIDLGVEETEAEYYAEGVRRGGTLVTVHDIADVSFARNILNRYGPVDIESRTGLWRTKGWMGYDPDAEPYTVEAIERERRL